MDRTQAERIGREFIDGYARALLDRAVADIAGHYAVPALIEFPGQAIVVTEHSQTEEFFRQAVGQYSGVSEAGAEVVVAAVTSHSIWLDVTWDYHGGAPGERNMYQLALRDGSWKIAVLTPLDG